MKVNMTPNPLDVVTIHASQGDTEARQWEFELHNNGELIDTSDVKEQLVFKAYEGGTEQILPTNGSTPTTSPFKGDIKYPQGLLSDQEFLYRECPTEEDGNAKIKSLYGNTLVWNQLVKNGNFANGMTDWYGASASITVSNGVCRVTIGSQEWNNDVRQNMVFVPNHRFLFSCDYRISSARVGELIFTVGDSNSGSTRLSNTTVKTRFVSFLTPTDLGTSRIRFSTASSQSSNQGEWYEVSNVYLIDLTQMGLDITSPSDFTSLFPLPYYDYCQGAMLSFGGRNVKFNQLVQNGNFADTSIWQASNTSFSVSSNVATIVPSASFGNISQQKQFTANHKYFATCELKLTSAVNTVSFRPSSTTTLMAQANTNWQKLSTIFTVANSGNQYYPRVTDSRTSGWDAIQIRNCMLIDLTEMFGDGNEPSAEGFLELFPNDYYEYNVGQYMNLGQPVSLKITGKNLNPWQGVEYSAVADRTIFLKKGDYVFSTDNGENLTGGANIYIAVFDKETNGNFITDGAITSNRFNLNGTRTYYYGGSAAAQPYAFTLNKDGFVSFGFNNVIPTNINALQLEFGSTATDYEPYVESTLSIPLDEFPNGMDGINDVKDEKNETGYKKKIGFVVVDGSEDEYWGFQSGTPNQCYHRMVVSTTLNNPPSISNYANRVTTYASLTGISYIIYSGELRISDMNGAITDVASLRAWLQAHPLVVAYALQEPLENYSVVDLGTLNWHTGGTNTSGIVRMESSDLRSVIKKPSAGNVPARILCNIYETKSADNTYTKNGAISLNTAGDIDVYDSNYNTSDKVSAFKQAMSGVYLLYEKENPQGFTTASLVAENGEIPLSNNDGILIGKCTEQLSSESGFFDAKIKLADEDGECYSNKIQLHVERSPQ